MNSRLSSLKILVCINTCEKDIDSLRKVEETDWYNKYCPYPNINIFSILADESIDGDYIFDGNTLLLRTRESYTELSVKIFHMLRAVDQLFPDYDYVLKLDSTVITTDRTQWDHRYGFDNFVREFENSFFRNENEGVLRITGNSVSELERWAQMSGIEVKAGEIFNPETGLKCPREYWAGNCYTLSRRLVKQLVRQEALFYLFRDYLGGCEDVCVATALLNSK